MVLHIFRKDWKLLWRAFLIFGFIEMLPALLRLHHGSVSGQLAFLRLPAVIIAEIAIVLMVIAIIQQDAIPGVTQDWFVRPIRRRDLFLAKLLFILLVQAVIFTSDVLQITFRSFTLLQAMKAALPHNLYFGVVLTLPAMCIAAVTETMMEAVIGSALVFLIGTAVDVTGTFLHGGSAYLHRSSSRSGIEWIGDYSGQVVLVVTVSLVLWRQYASRQTAWSRRTTVYGAVAFALTLFLPWNFSFGIQEKLSGDQADASSIRLSLGQLTLDRSPTVERAGAEPDATHLLLPIEVSGMPNHTVLKSDRTMVRLLSANGKEIYRTEIDPWVWESGTPSVPLGFFVPARIIPLLRDKAFTVELEHSLTILANREREKVPAFNGTLRSSDIGHCSTSSGRSGAAIILRCQQPGNGSQCVHAFLQNSDTMQRVDSLPGWCTPDYSPGLEQISKDPLSTFGMTFFLRDPFSGTVFPSDEASLRRSMIVIDTFAPLSHFHRAEQVDVPVPMHDL
ncbi:MAG: hypothetical protein JSS87_03155 [Acidobacteria bacterium]|nr:hypothetical protein [Acidobacteriota bacterium]